MSETEEQSQTSDSDFEPRPEDFTVMQIVQEVLASHDGLDEYYKGMNSEQQFRVAMKAMYNSDFQPLSGDVLKSRIKLHFEIRPNQIIAAHHFSKASYECIKTYRAGLFIACTMMTHPINEGIIKFAAKRNNIARECKEDLPETIEKLRKVQLLNNESAEASKAIWRSYRNAIHHMREDISKIQDWHQQAKQNLRNLEKVESCVFGFDYAEGGTINVHYPQHWDRVGDEHIKIWLRID